MWALRSTKAFQAPAPAWLGLLALFACACGVEPQAVETLQVNLDFVDRNCVPAFRLPSPYASLASARVTLTAQGRAHDSGCVAGLPNGRDPYLLVTVPDGFVLRATSELGGEAQVRLEFDGRLVGDRPLTFMMTAAPVEIAMPPHGDDGTTLLRLDPPSRGTTTVCLAPRQESGAWLSSPGT